MVQNELQRYIFKIHSSRIRNAKWKLELPIPEARRNEEIISLAGSQMLTWIDELNGVVDGDEKARAIRSEIRFIKGQANSAPNKRRIRKLYAELDVLQFKADYVEVIIDRVSDYHRLCKGFYINNIKYRRLLGTVNGIKNSTIVFINEELYPELIKRINNGRNESKPINPSKLEAYRALTCSASVPVSMPDGVLVVQDSEVDFFDDVIYLANSEGDGEPIMRDAPNEPIHMDASDGFGLMLPSLAERWSKDLGLDYVVSGLNSRFAFSKGMIFTFDFLAFARDVAGSYIVKDAWGYEVDIRNVELILTVSMVKLWDSYGSCDEYLKKSRANKYSFRIPKVCPRELESERTLNYQFIQSFPLDDDDINELVAPTVSEFKDVLGGDWRRALLFLCGSNINEKMVRNMSNDYVKALMIDPEIINDPYVRQCIYRQIKNRIKEAKTGVINVHGNYSIVCGDPYGLMQSIFGLEVTGLLKSGEIYNKYWSDHGAEKVVCFRAPMSTHNNVRVVRPVVNEDISYWYQYMNTCTILNSWDTVTAALNGMDFDGDMVMITDNPVLLRKHVKTPTLMCMQSKASKIIPTEEDLINSNIATFGNDIGKVTNRVTAMFEKQCNFDRDSKEFKTLDYRIKCGQLIQQDVIDKAKGIVAKPMSKLWYDHHAVSLLEDEDKQKLYRSILVDKKPYFMKYIYPSLSKDYSNYIKCAERNCLRQFGIKIDDLRNIPSEDLAHEQSDFIAYLEYNSPVGTSPCVMNKICWRFENEFDNSENRYESFGTFNASNLMSGREINKQIKAKLKKEYQQYIRRIKDYTNFSQYEKVNPFSVMEDISVIRHEFAISCSILCPDRFELCDTLLDLTYSASTSKKFAWEMCGDEIIEGLLSKNNYTMSFPVLSENGDIEYNGKFFKMTSITMEEID